MSRTVYVNVNVKLTILVDDDQDFETVMDELDYTFSDTTEKATVEDSCIEDFEVIDSK